MVIGQSLDSQWIVIVLTGCTRMSWKNSKYCWEHEVIICRLYIDISNIANVQGEETPCHIGSELSKETVTRLTGPQAKEFFKVNS